MNFLTDESIKKLFCRISGILAIFIALVQIAVLLLYGGFSLPLLLLSLSTGILILGATACFFQNQERTFKKAENHIRAYLSGNTDSRIECDQEGSLYKLFHSVNTLATVLDAHAAREQQGKEFLRRTISDISHQLKTPLAALDIYNGILQDETLEPASIQEFALLSEQELDRIENLVQNLLKISRLDSGTMILEKTSENISDLMHDVLRHFEFRIRQEEKAVVFSGSEDVMLLCDRGWLFEAVSNLVKNALDHTDTGSQILIEWKQLPSITQISVRDNGCGIDPEDIHHIFKRFYRSRFSGDRQGAGLGLPLVKAIAEAHGGTILADSIPGRGSSFVLGFPNLTKP